MQKIVEVPGVGNVEFPDSMSDADIGSVIQRQHPELLKSGTIAPSLLASRQEASKMEFERNLPEQTAGTGLREAALSLWDSVRNSIHKPELDLMNPEVRRGPLQPGVGSMVHGVIDPPVNYVKAQLAGQPDDAARQVGPILTQTVPAVAGVLEAAKALPGAARAAGNAVTSPDALLSRVDALKAKMAAPSPNTVPLSKFAVAKTAVKSAVDVTRGPRATVYRSIADQLAKDPAYQAEVLARETAYQSALEEQRNSPIRDLPVFGEQPKIGTGRPSTPTHVEQQLADARVQAAHENFPSGEFRRGPAEPPAEIPMPNPPEGGPSPVTDRTISQVKQQLAPSAPSAKMSVGRYTPRLLQEMPELADPTLHGVHNQPAFDAKLFDGFRQRESAVIAAEDAVPDGTRVIKKPIMDTIQESIDAAEKYANPKLTGSLERLKATWEKLPETIPWPDFVKAKRDFFNANNGNSYLVRQVYRALTEATSEASPELAAANKAYSIVRTAVDDAGIIRSGPAAGQRLRAQGVRPKATMAEQLRQSQPSRGMPVAAPAAADTVPAAPTVEPPAMPLRERIAMFRKASAGNVGAALPTESRGLAQMIDARFAQIRDAARSGVTDTTGKALGKAGPEAGSANYGTETIRRGGGMLNAFPELKNVGATPAQIAEAIDRGSGVLYGRVRKVVADAMRASRESRPESGPSSLFSRFSRARQTSQPPF